MVESRVYLLACLLLVSAALGAAPGGATAGGSADADSGTADQRAALVNLQEAPAADNTITRIVVHENGSATWTLQIRTRLETDDNESDYRAFQERFRENESRYIDDFRAGITGIVGNAREVTGREMEATGFHAETSIQSIPRRWGVVTFEFRWDGFAATDGDALRVGDVFQGGLFIAEGDSLEIVAPDGYRIESADPAPDEAGDGVVTWTGREDFADGRPQVVIAPTGTAGAGSPPWQAIAIGAALVGLAAVAALGYRRFGGRSGGAAAASGDGGTGGGATAESNDEPLLADEDHVLRLLADRGGRMRQQAIAEELDWSRSKTSRVLGRMDDADQVGKLKLGRENVIALPEESDEPGEGSGLARERGGAHRHVETAADCYLESSNVFRDDNQSNPCFARCSPRTTWTGRSTSTGTTSASSPTTGPSTPTRSSATGWIGSRTRL